MKAIIFKANMFMNKGDRQRSERILISLLDVLVETNIDYLSVYPRTPSLYKSGVRYKREDGTEEWKAIPEIIKDGHGDCEDLATWRVAELRIKGIPAEIDLISQRRGNFFQYHVRVILPGGKIEDPSLRLGMRS